MQVVTVNKKKQKIENMTCNSSKTTTTTTQENETNRQA